MMVKNLDANIDRATAASVAAASFCAITIATGFIAALGFARRVDGALSNGCNRLRLNLGNGFGYRFLRHHAGRNRRWWNRGHLHNLFPIKLLEHYPCRISRTALTSAGAHQKTPIKTTQEPNNLLIPELPQTSNTMILPQHNQKIINHLVFKSSLIRIGAILNRLLSFNFNIEKSSNIIGLLSGSYLWTAERSS
jgi:hypothetical protein